MNFFIKNKLMIGLAIVTCLYVTNTNSGTESIPGLGGVKDVLKRVGNMGSELSQQELKPNYWKTGICAVLYGLSYYMGLNAVVNSLQEGAKVGKKNKGVSVKVTSRYKYGLILLNGFMNVLPSMGLDSLQTGNFVDKNVILGLGVGTVGFVQGYGSERYNNKNADRPLFEKGRECADSYSKVYSILVGTRFGCELLGKSINFLRGNNKA